MYLSEDDICEDDLSRPPGRLIILLLLFVSLISSCGKKQSSQFIKKEKNKRNVSILEAKYSDIPLPFGFKLIDLEKNEPARLRAKSAELISYAGLLGRDQVVDYYLAGMEKHGWEIVDLSNAKEGLLFCSKPWKYCVISVRDDLKFSKKNGHSHVHLFVKNKLKEVKKEKDINAKDVNGFGVRL